LCKLLYIIKICNTDPAIKITSKYFNSTLNKYKKGMNKISIEILVMSKKMNLFLNEFNPANAELS